MVWVSPGWCESCMGGPEVVWVTPDWCGSSQLLTSMEKRGRQNMVDKKHGPTWPLQFYQRVVTPKMEHSKRIQINKKA